MKILISSSSVAAAIGENKYKMPREVFESMFKVKFKDQYRDIEQKLGKNKFKPTQQHQVEQLLKTFPELENISTIGKTGIHVDETRVNHIVKETQTKITEFIQNTPEINEDQKKLVSESITSAIRCESGNVTEVKITNEQKITENNKTYMELIMGNVGNSKHKWGINGFCDGKDVDGEYVEIKSRTSKHIFNSKSIPHYDKIQMHCYMKMLKVKSMKLIERLARTGEEKVSHIDFDDELWSSKILPELMDFAEKFLTFLMDEELQLTYFSLETEKEKENYYNNCIN
jgi:hypothetical protein